MNEQENPIEKIIEKTPLSIDNTNIEVRTNNSQIFNYARRSSMLIVVSIIGIILSIIYFKMKIGCDIAEHICGGAEKKLNTITTIVHTLYYGGVAILLLISAIKLQAKKKIGLYLFSIVILCIIISLLIPSDLFLSEYGSSDLGFYNSFFVNSIIMALLGSIFMLGLPILGVFIYFWIIIKNFILINKWARFLDIQGKWLKFFHYLKWLSLIVIILIAGHFFFMKYFGVYIENFRFQKSMVKSSNYNEPINMAPSIANKSSINNDSPNPYYYDNSWNYSVFLDIENNNEPLPEWWINGDWPLTTVDNPPKILAGEVPRILFWWAAYLHYYDTEKKQWFVEPDQSIATNSYDLLSFCRRYYPNTTTVKKYKKENIPLARDDNKYVLEPTINPWSFECVQ